MSVYKKDDFDLKTSTESLAKQNAKNKNKKAVFLNAKFFSKDDIKSNKQHELENNIDIHNLVSTEALEDELQKSMINDPVYSHSETLNHSNFQNMHESFCDKNDAKDNNDFNTMNFNSNKPKNDNLNYSYDDLVDELSDDNLTDHFSVNSFDFLTKNTIKAMLQSELGYCNDFMLDKLHTMAIQLN